MSRQATNLAGSSAVEQTRSRRYELVLELAAVLCSAVVILALAYDLVTARWVGEEGTHIAVGLVAVLLLLPLARRVRHLQLAVLYTFGLFVYTVLRSFAGHTFIPVRTLYVIRIDRALFFGHEPTQWLQARLFDPTRLRPLDWLTVQVHWSYFAVPHIAALLIYIWRRDLFPRFVALVLGTFYAGLTLYFLAPTVPPWLAADNGALPGVARVMDFVGGQVDPASYERLYDALGVPNPVAAMPSLHMAITFALFLFGRQINRWLGWALLAYSLLMGFSLVYMGEHYATDVLVGALIAFCVYRIVVHLSPRAPETKPVEA